MNLPSVESIRLLLLSLLDDGSVDIRDEDSADQFLESMDSLDVLELVVRVEEQFSIILEPEDLPAEGITIRALATAVHLQLA